LIRSWIEDAGLSDRVAWVSVERGERDAQRFWLSVNRQLVNAAGRDGFVEGLSPAPGFHGSLVVERLLSDLGSLEEPVVLVVDDLHELRSADALAQLELMLSQLPRQLRVVLATRRDPQLGLHRLRLAGELTEVRVADLRFSLEEARELLRTSGVVLSDASLGVLHERTEGWAAGLRLAAISLAGHPDPERFVADFHGSERTVADYLLTEVLNRQPEQVRHLLLRTSVLERVNGPLADLLTGGFGSERILLALEDADAFVFSLDAQRSWFRYHQLLADLLRLELRRTDAESIPSLHRAAAQWHAENGHVLDATRHMQAAGAWQEAARLLAGNIVGLLLDGHWETTHALIAAFPVEAAAEDAELAAVLAADQLLRGSLDETARYLAVAQRQAAALPDEQRRRLDVLLAVGRLGVARRRGDVKAAFDEVQSLEHAWVAPTSSEIALSNDLQALALMALGNVELLWLWRLEDAQRHLEEALALARRSGRPFLEIVCLGDLALASYPTSIALARQHSEEAIAIAEAHGWGADPIVTVALVMFAGALVWQGRFEEASGWLDRAERTLRSEAEPVTALLFNATKGMLLAGQGRHHQALAAYRVAEQMRALLVTQDFTAADYLHSALLQTQARLGETAAARAAITALDEEQLDRADLRNAVAAVHLAEGNPRAAVEVLVPIAEGSAPVAIPASRIQALLLGAAAHAQLGDMAAAEGATERALELAEPDAMILPFATTPVRDLLEHHPRHRTSHAGFLSDILAVLAGSSPAPRRDHAAAALEELSDAELRVLRYLPSNLAAPEIAAELYLSANTVKTHMRHLYAKLSAHTRTQAVARARELGLLAPSRRHG
jgi:LuxR family maltose regulon positive regulatory protein